MIGERIKTARVAAGLSQRALGERAELSAMAISKYERGVNTPTSPALLRLARALGVRVEYFFRTGSAALEGFEYRTRSRIGKKQLAAIHADVREQAERLVETLALFPELPIATFEVPDEVPASIDDYDAVERVAVAVRRAWGLGENGIPCLADTYEERGVLVLMTGVDGCGSFDGLSATLNGLPLVVVCGVWPGDRQRFTLAHELGHLVLAGRLGDDVDPETAANRFAGAFLVPAETARRELGGARRDLEPRELHALKHEYGMSMKAWVHRAFEVGAIDAPVRQQLFRRFREAGWDEREPGTQIPPEPPRLAERLVLHAMAEGMISTSKAAELCGLPIAAFLSRLRFEEANEPARQ